MHSWEVVCIEIDEDSEFDDCRAITSLGYHAPSIKTASADVVGARIHQDHSAFHVEIDGERLELRPGHDPEVNFYVRTREEDEAEDPLLGLEPCTQYELDQRLEGLS